MNKPPYQPTAQQMQAQAQAALQAQQQAYLQQAQQAQQALTGVPYGGHWYPGTTASSSATGTAYLTYVGANGTVTHYPATLGTYAEPTSPTIEEAGIRAGEITGYRAWYLRSDDELWSMYVGYVWQPGVQRITDERVNRHMGNGFHAFKDMEQCRREYPGLSIVYGEVALWGEVYEHERGYRAEWARVTRIIEVCEKSEPPWIRFWRRPTIHKLRSKYGVIE